MRASTGAAGALGEAPTDVFLAADAFSTRGDFTYFSSSGTEYNLLDDHLLERANNDKRQLSTHARWRLGEPSLRGGLYSSFLSRDEGLAGHAEFPTTAPPLATLPHLGAAQLELAGGAASGWLRAWRSDRREDFADPLGEVGIGIQDQRDHTASTGLGAHAGWAPRAWLAPSLTLTARRDSFDRFDETSGAADPRQVRQVVAATPAVTLRPLEDRLVLTGSCRATWLDNRSLQEVELSSGRTTGAVPTWLGADPRAGALVRLTDGIALAANGGYASRPPDMTELFGDRGVLEGNAHLRPERGVTWDAGARGRLERGPLEAAAEVAYFQNRMEDLILYVQNSQRTLVPVNIEDGRVRGVEAAGRLALWGRALTLEASLTRNVSENLSDDPAYAGNQLPRVPAWEAVERLGAGWGERLRAGHSFTYTAGNYWDRTNWYLSPPRHIHGLFATAPPH